MAKLEGYTIPQSFSLKYFIHPRLCSLGIRLACCGVCWSTDFFMEKIKRPFHAYSRCMMVWEKIFEKMKVLKNRNEARLVDEQDNF